MTAKSHSTFRAHSRYGDRSVIPTFTIPEEDQGEFQRLPKEVRNDVDMLLIEFERVYCAQAG